MSVDRSMHHVSGSMAALFSLLMVCTTTARAAETESFRTLAKGTFSGIHESKKELIKTQAAWEKLWAAHSSETQPPEDRPRIDFSEKMVVVLTMGRQRTGGYAIEIVRIERADSKLKIFYKRTAPQPGSITIQALTAPFHFVAVARTGRKPEFIETAL